MVVAGQLPYALLLMQTTTFTNCICNGVAFNPSWQVLDEPLYAHFLTLTGAERPYTQLVRTGTAAAGAAAAGDSEGNMPPSAWHAQLAPSRRSTTDYLQQLIDPLPLQSPLVPSEQCRCCSRRIRMGGGWCRRVRGGAARRTATASSAGQRVGRAGMRGARDPRQPHVDPAAPSSHITAAPPLGAPPTLQEQLLAPRRKPVLYAKHMAKHRVGLGPELLRRARHVLLVRRVKRAPLPVHPCLVHHHQFGGCFLWRRIPKPQHPCRLSCRAVPSCPAGSLLQHSSLFHPSARAFPNPCRTSGFPLHRCREPAAVIQSFSEVLEPTLTETCYPALLELYSELRVLG